MTQHVLLNNIEHRALRVITTRSARYGDDVMASPTFPPEFRHVQAHYPIVFARTQEGAFTPLALYGFREKQNLYLDGDRWDAMYVPLMVERIPFLIGTQGPGKVVHIDMESPRVSQTEGEKLFVEDGANTAYMDRVTSMLAAIDEGHTLTAPFIEALNQHDLLESFALDIEYRDGTRQRFVGFHAIQEERLSKLGAEALGALHQRGFLQPIYMVLASFSNFRGLIERASKLDAADR